MSKLGDSRAVPPTLQEGSMAWPRDRTSQLLVSWLLGQALALQEEKLCSLFSVSSTPASPQQQTAAVRVWQVYTAVEGPWMSDKVTKRGSWPTANQLHVF